MVLIGVRGACRAVAVMVVFMGTVGGVEPY
jgi:hypothetical protein